MLPEIPKTAKPHEVGIYLAYAMLGIRDPRELTKLFHYRSKSSVNNVLVEIRTWRKTIGSATVEADTLKKE